MDDKLKPIEKQNYPLCRLKLVVETLNTQLNKKKQSKFTKVPKVVKPTNKKTLL